MLDTRTPNINFLPSVLRMALGGIAGIVIGWFWVPAPSKGAELVAITSAPFALAFLAGFSIDILFSLLDRLNRAISDEPGRGAPPVVLSSKVSSP
jgi:ABC-type proline/glycine betaine transport system permease subunit